MTSGNCTVWFFFGYDGFGQAGLEEVLRMIAFVLTTQNCGGLIPVDMLRAGGRSGGRGR